MKKFKITLVTELELPDDFEIATESRDQFLCLKRGCDYYYPTFDWMGRHLRVEGSIYGKHETAPAVGWTSTDDDTANEFIEAGVGNERYEIEQIP